MADKQYNQPENNKNAGRKKYIAILVLIMILLCLTVSCVGGCLEKPTEGGEILPTPTPVATPVATPAAEATPTATVAPTAEPTLKPYRLPTPTPAPTPVPVAPPSGGTAPAADPMLIKINNANIKDWQSSGDDVYGEAQNNIVNFALRRNTGTKFARNSDLALWAWTGDSATVPADKVVDGVVNTFDGSKWTAGTTMKWKNDTDDHHFLFVSPARTITDFTSDEFILNTSDPTANDIMVAKSGAGIKYARGKNGIDADFEHLMAKVVVNLHFRNQWGGTPSIKDINIEGGYTKATIDYINKTVTNPENPDDVKMMQLPTAAENFDLSYETILIPTNDTRAVIINIDNVDYEYNHDTYIPLESGKCTTINLNVGKDEITLANITINDWENNGDHINGEGQKTRSLNHDGNATTFETGAQISLFAWTGAADEVPANRVVDNTINTYDGTKWTAVPQMRWKDRTTEHYFLGVYPAHEITDFKADPYTLDTSDQDKSDLLIAVNNGGLKTQDNPVQLKFDHRMAKLRVNINFRNQWGNVPTTEKVEFTGYTQAEVDYMTKNVTAKGNKTAIGLPEMPLPVTGFDKSYESVVIPADETGNIVVKIAGKEYIYEPVEEIPLVKGKCTTIDLNVGKDKIELRTVTVTGWDGTETSFAQGDSIRVSGWIGDKTTVPLNSPIKSINTLDANNRWQAQPQMLWQSQTAAHYFLGVYPVPQTDIVNYSADTFAFNKTDMDANDIMVAVSDDRGIVANNRGVALEFTRIMSKLIVNVKFDNNKFGDTVPTPDRVKLYTNTDATIDYLIKKVTTTPYSYDASEFANMHKTDTTAGYDATYRVIVPPCTGVTKIGVVINGVEHTYTATADIPLTSGNVTTLDIEI